MIILELVLNIIQYWTIFVISYQILQWYSLEKMLCFCFYSSCVLYVASFSGLSFFDCPLRYSLTFI